MCGRYVSVRSDDDVLRDFDAVAGTDDDSYEPDWNIAPTKPVRTIVNRPLRAADGTPAATPTRQLRVMSWGLVPSWAKDRKTQGRMFNARVESVPDKPAFRAAYAKRRCLVPADGWYEWQTVDGPDGPVKQPMYMAPPDGHVIAFAGLYEFWRGGDGPTLSTCTIITTDSAGALAAIHDRMPLVLSRDVWARWLDPAVTDPSDLLRSWDEARGEHLDLRPVATTVNNVENNGADLVVPVEPAAEAQTLF
ncbi:MAG TPA: SOS response-associated peptidase [Jatrophihabitans sp.]|jgi:putative SOS response-associated peptidase YedK